VGCARISRICVPNLSEFDSAGDPYREYIYFKGSKTLPSTSYILSDESNTPSYSTIKGYKNMSIKSFLQLLPYFSTAPKCFRQFLVHCPGPPLNCTYVYIFMCDKGNFQHSFDQSFGALASVN